MSGPENHSPKEFGWIDLYIGEGYSDMKQVAGGGGGPGPGGPPPPGGFI
jgi:hypothetical protein